MIVTIHQPNFFPWWPFFQKMSEADVFVVLRHCQFEKNNFQNRFQYDGAWMTMSTHRGLEPIVDKRYIDPHADWSKIKRKLGDPKYLDQFDADIRESLWETNYNIITRIASIFGLKTKVVLDEPTMLKSTQRLVKICKDLNATQYLSGTGGKNYLDASLFEREGIDVKYQVLSPEQKVHTIDKLKEAHDVE